MSRVRRDIQALDWQSMPTVDTGALTDPARAIYQKHLRLLEGYLNGESISSIETQSGIQRTHLYRLIKRCLALHDDGRVYGYRALLPQTRVNSYCRIALATPLSDRGGRGTAGAFSALLDRYPALVDWLRQQIRGHHVILQPISSRDKLRTRLQGIVGVHQKFILQCKALGIGASEYPLNTARMGRGALTRALTHEMLRSFGCAARSAGAKHLKGLPRNRDEYVPSASHPLDIVEFDGHRLDLRLKVVVQDPLGGEHEFAIERVWILVILDVCTRAVLGYYHLCLGREYSRYDVVRTIEKALEPHRVLAFLADGAEIGELKAQGAWGEFVHDIELRRAILRERDVKRLAAFADPSFLEAYVRDKMHRAKHSQRAASELTRTIRVLATAPTAVSPLPQFSQAALTTPDSKPPAPTAPGTTHKIEPLVLTIGTGYAG